MGYLDRIFTLKYALYFGKCRSQNGRFEREIVYIWEDVFTLANTIFSQELFSVQSKWEPSRSAKTPKFDNIEFCVTGTDDVTYVLWYIIFID